MNVDELKNKLSQIGIDGTHPEDARVTEVIESIAVYLRTSGLSEDAQEQVLDLLSDKVRDKIEALPNVTEKDWENFNLGNVKVGHYVRVKRDAYNSPIGSTHNGLVGILSYMSHGRCTVNYVGLKTGKKRIHPYGKLDSLKLGVK